jgi:type I restriction enzyme S subunit
MRKYPKYKESGYPWYGEVPKEWEVKDLKHELKFQTGGTPSTKDSKYYDGENTWVTIGDMNGAVVTDSSSRITVEGIKAANIPLTPKGSLLYSFKLSVGQVAFAGKDFYTNEAIASFLPSSKYEISYWYYALPFSLIHNANENIYGAKLLNQELIKNAGLIVPSKEEQRAIVRFLDFKTGQIDSFVANRQKQIELLKEQKASIINKAVTKGVNSNAKMKDSGIEWIGEVPEYWEIWKTKFLCKKVSTGNTPSSNELKYYENGTINWFTPGDFKDEFKMENSQRKVTEIAIDEKECKLFGAHSTYVIGIGATLGKVRMSETIASANQQINVLEFNKKVLPEFGFFYFYSIEKTIIANANLSTMGIINQTKMKNLEMPLPPIEEQSAILNYINNENLAFDTLISKYQKQIDLMQEYRTSLISQAVTGKIDVREWQPKRQQTA